MKFLNSLLLRTQSILAITASVLLLPSCALVDAQQAAMPTGISDGLATHRFVGKHAFLLDRPSQPDDVATYTGQWVSSKPKGQGVAVSYDGRSCQGEFGVQPPIFSDENYSKEIWGNGNVYFGKKLVYKGSFINYFRLAETCSPKGWGTRYLQNGKITGQFFDFDRIERGSCKLERLDGSSYEGGCDSPNKTAGTSVINVPDDIDPFSLAVGPGVFTDSKGKKLSAADASTKLSCLKDATRKLDSAQRAYDAALRACQRNVYTGNSMCLGIDGNMRRGIKLADAVSYAKEDLERVRGSESLLCNDLDPASLRSQAAEEKRINEKNAQERANNEHERDEQEASRAANTTTYSTPTPSPFQGLDSINKVMQDGQRRIIPAQPGRADQQQRGQRQATQQDRQSALTPQPAATAAKSEGRVVTILRHEESLYEHQTNAWCTKATAESRDMGSSGNQFISMGTCTCKPGGNGIDFQKQFSCEFPVTFREFSSNSK
jgi:hypothetical protein